mmetsp:Transcript_25282/g.88212  ORF Transcript_25282/g.88212 Transcript_25282/m.88212 type:complete len:214 (-) Transcript_25282:2227-2868(-)
MAGRPENVWRGVCLRRWIRLAGCIVHCQRIQRCKRPIATQPHQKPHGPRPDARVREHSAQALVLDEGRIRAARQRQQRLVRPTLHDAACVHDQNLVGRAHRAQAVRDDERGAPDQEAVESSLHGVLARGVEARSRLVQHQHSRISHERACEADALPLAARQAHAALADQRVIATGEARDEVVRARGARGGLDALLARARLHCVRDVVGDRAVE